MYSQSRIRKYDDFVLLLHTKKKRCIYTAVGFQCDGRSNVCNLGSSVELINH